MVQSNFHLLPLLVSIHQFVTFALFGLIWTIQLVHYPSFHFINENEFSKFEKFHSTKISWVVAPLMIAELFLSIAFLYLTEFSPLYSFLFLVVLFIWISTFTLSVPCHKKLSLGKDSKTIDQLVKTNWIRTILWSLKSLILCL